MNETSNAGVEKKLDTLIGLVQHLLAIELSKCGMTHDAIRKHLGVGKATVNSMLMGVKKEK